MTTDPAPDAAPDDEPELDWPGNISPAAHEDYASDTPKRWPFFVVLGLLVCGGLVAAAPLLISSSWLSGLVSDWLKENLETPASFQTLDVSWSEGIKMTGLEVRESRDSKDPLLYAPLVEIDAAFLPLLVQRLEVKKFVFHDPVVRIAQNEDGTVKTEEVVKKKKVRKKDGEDGEEADVWPEMDVPVDVHNLAFVFVAADGTEVRREGIVFSGHLTTRYGPSTFRLRVPDGAGELAVDGEATLFGPLGTVLPTEQISVRSTIVISDLDAATNRDLLLLFTGDAPAQGRLDGNLDVTTSGTDAQGSIDLRLSGVAQHATAAAAGTENLRIAGRFLKQDERIELSDFVVHGEGLNVVANVAGPVSALDGRATLGADLERSAAALRRLGFEIPDGITGRLDGELTFTAATGAADGRLVATDVHIPSSVEDGGAFVLDHADGALRARMGEDAVTLDSLEVRLPEGTLTSKGRFGTDGTLDVRTILAGDVGALLARARHLGLAPPEMALAGTLDAAIVTRRTLNETGIGVTVETLSLRGDGVAIDASGTIGADGALDLSARGDGSIEKLLATGAADAAGMDLSTVRGTFRFAASAGGSVDAPEVVVDSLRLDGDVQLDAQGKLGSDEAVEARITLSGTIANAVALARRLGFVEGDVPLDGRISVDLRAAGTLDAPEIPEATIALTDGPLQTRVVAAITAAGALSGTCNVDADVDALLRVAVAQGFLSTAPTTNGRVTVSAILGGTRDAPEVPSALLRLEGPADVSVDATLDAGRTMMARLQFRGALQPLADIAAAFRAEPRQQVSGDYEGSASVGGTLDAPLLSLQRLLVRSSGLTASAQATYRPDGSGESTVEVSGPLEGLFDLLHVAGFAGSHGGTGRLDLAMETSLSGVGDDQSVVGSLTGALSDLVLLNADQSGGEWRESSVRLSVPSFRYQFERGTTVGPILATLTTGSGLRAQASFDGGSDGEELIVKATALGPLQPLLDAAAFATGGRRSVVPGELDLAARLEGPLDDATVEITRADVKSDTFAIESTGSLSGVGSDAMRANGRAQVRGAIASLVAIAHSAGLAEDVDVQGNVDATADLLGFDGHVASLRVQAIGTEVHVLAPPVGSGTFREPRIEIPATALHVETASGNVRPFDAVVRMQGLDLAARVGVTNGVAPPDGSPASLLVDATDGKLTVREEFTTNHPELLPDMRLGGATGTFAFRGDVGRGMEGAAGWTGTVNLTATQFAAPYVDMPRAVLVGVLREGMLHVEPLDLQVNGGTATGKADIGLLGEKPVHQVELHAKNVAIKADMAPLLSRVAPILAVGDAGRAGGTTGMDVTLTAKGLDGATLRRTITGSGTLLMSNVFAESGNWIGTLLDLVGSGGGRLDITSATVPFEVKRGKVTTQPVGMSGGAMDLLLGGTVGLDGALDYAFKVRPKTRGGTFDKYAKVVDKDGFLPLRLEGDIGDPSLKLPSIKDILTGGGLGGLLDGLKDRLNPDDKDEDADDDRRDPDRPKRNGRKKRRNR